MGLGPFFAAGAGMGACLLAWFCYGLHYSGVQAVRLLFLCSALPLWFASSRAVRYSNEAQRMFKSVGEQVPKEFGQVSEALTSHAGWARPGLLEDYQRWQRTLSFLGGVAITGMLGAFVFGIGVLQGS
ncbi:hypothetical protein DBR42_07635 [Pelomonas sp. HMWF004]|nr:hypothetical protein DBR42_07635 [Pelomonas sp. HMWF004]